METNAGSGSFFEDVDYKEAGAEIVAEQAKVCMWRWLFKEPFLESEYPVIPRRACIIHLSSFSK